MQSEIVTQNLGSFSEKPTAELAHKPTPIEYLKNLSARIGNVDLYVKRDDCTGLAFGGNKVRQLEFYLGEAVARSADTVLITGAVQSNFVRLASAAACKLGMECHIQLEDRVPDVDDTYRNSGNVLLDRLLGAHIYYYDEGEDEAGADRRIREIGQKLEDEGRTPYVIPLAPGHAPLGALGYVDCAREIIEQANAADLEFDEVVVASGSGHTHAGMLFGLQALGSGAKVTGICVRRDATRQLDRIRSRCTEIAGLLDIESPVKDTDINLLDDFLAPGYGQLNSPTVEAMQLAARLEALILDPTYTGKAMAGFLHLARQRSADAGGTMLFVHTGGQPAIFGSEAKLTEVLLRSAPA